MLKRDEVQDEDSCLNRAGFDEMLFVLRAHDIVAPSVIRFWADERIRLRKNKSVDSIIIDALNCADIMEKQQKEGI